MCHILAYIIGKARYKHPMVRKGSAFAHTNTDVLLNACKDIGLAVNTGKIKYMEIGRHRGMVLNAHIKIGSNSYEK